MAVAIAMTCLPVSAQELRKLVHRQRSAVSVLTTPAPTTWPLGGFVTGIADAMGIVLLAPFSRVAERACIPLAATEGQALDLVKRFLEQHPAEPQEEKAVSLVARKPCPKPSRASSEGCGGHRDGATGPPDEPTSCNPQSSRVHTCYDDKLPLSCCLRWSKAARLLLAADKAHDTRRPVFSCSSMASRRPTLRPDLSPWRPARTRALS